MKVSGARTTDIEGRSPQASAGARAGERENASRPTDARSIQLALARSRQTPPTGDETSAKAAERMLARWGAAAPRRVIKIALGLSSERRPSSARLCGLRRRQATVAKRSGKAVGLSGAQPSAADAGRRCPLPPARPAGA